MKIEKVLTAAKIEYHWLIIKGLRKIIRMSEKSNELIDSHKFRASQLRDQYEVLAGIPRKMSKEKIVK